MNKAGTETNKEENSGGNSLIDSVADWLMAEALKDTAAEELLGGCCERLWAAGVPLWRGHVAFQTLHPLFAAMGLTWYRGQETEVFQFPHQAEEEAEMWSRSPLFHIIKHGLPFLRRRLTGSEALRDFPVLNDLAQEGGTDYIAYLVIFNQEARDGVVGSWVTDQPGGFTDGQLAALARIQKRLAVALKMTMKAQIARNVLDTYIGMDAGQRVLDGQIRRGDGDIIRAAIWYSDLRRSTELAEALSMADFLALLNRYFECTAEAVLQAGGEVLLLIGDAVLAIFPFDKEGEEFARRACERAVTAARDAEARLTAANRSAPEKQQLAFGLGLHLGELMYGNIGVPQRLQFTVVGRAVNEVTRLEALSKTIAYPVIASAAFAEALPIGWLPLGRQALRGIDEPQEVFALPPAR